MAAIFFIFRFNEQNALNFNINCITGRCGKWKIRALRVDYRTKENFYSSDYTFHE